MELLSLIPLVVLLGSIALGRPLLEATVAFFLATLSLTIFWQMDAGAISQSFVKGGFIALDLSLIVFGALLLMGLLRRTNLLESLTRHLSRISPDVRVQTIILAWLLGGFIEGIAGFGTPAAVIAPLLVGLGYTPIGAISIALIANTAAVAFGALGTPITIGLGGADVAPIIGSMNLIAFFVPVFLLVIITREKGGSFKDALPFALFAGAAFVVPAMIASTAGPAYPSIIGAGVGLILTALIARLGWLMPRETIRAAKDARPEHTIIESTAPYLTLLAVLIAQRFIDPPTIALFGVEHALPLANPGIAFFVASALLVRRATPHTSDVVSALRPALLILVLASSVQVMINSSQNALGLPSMTASLASLTQALPLEVTAPLLGALGAFFAGSATVSNLLFSPVHLAAGGGAVALAGQTLGASYANMISLQNIVAVQATVGVSGNERSILSNTILPAGILITVLIIVSLLL